MPPGRNEKGEAIRYVPRLPDPFRHLSPETAEALKEAAGRVQARPPPGGLLPPPPRTFPPYPLSLPREAHDLKSVLKLVNALRNALLKAGIANEEDE